MSLSKPSIIQYIKFEMLHLLNIFREFIINDMSSVFYQHRNICMQVFSDISNKFQNIIFFDQEHFTKVLKALQFILHMHETTNVVIP